VVKTAGLLTFHSSLQAVLFGSHQDEEPFGQESAGRLAWGDQQVVALPRETYSFIKKCIIIEQCAVPENIHTPPTEGIGISWGWGVL